MESENYVCIVNVWAMNETDFRSMRTCTAAVANKRVTRRGARARSDEAIVQLDEQPRHGPVPDLVPGEYRSQKNAN